LAGNKDSAILKVPPFLGVIVAGTEETGVDGAMELVAVGAALVLGVALV
jgi:hypothetical protein